MVEPHSKITNEVDIPVLEYLCLNRVSKTLPKVEPIVKLCLVNTNPHRRGDSPEGVRLDRMIHTIKITDFVHD